MDSTCGEFQHIIFFNFLNNPSFGSPFLVPFRSPFCSKSGPLLVPFLNILGPLLSWAQWRRLHHSQNRVYLSPKIFISALPLRQPCQIFFKKCTYENNIYIQDFMKSHCSSFTLNIHPCSNWKILCNTCLNGKLWNKYIIYLEIPLQLFYLEYSPLLQLKNSM